MLNATWFVLAGMGITFATLGLLMLAMMALNSVLKPASGAKARATKAGHA